MRLGDTAHAASSSPARTMRTLLALLVIVYLLGCAPRDGEAEHGASRSATLEAFAKAWPDRADGALDFRLSARPEARYLLVPPPDYAPDHDYELWVAVFGQPSSSEQALAEWRRYARERNAFLLAPHGSTRLAPRSTQARWDLHRDPEEITEMVDEVSRRFRIDRKRLAIMGSSSGGAVAWSTVSKHPNLFRFIAVNSTPWTDAWEEIDRRGLWEAGKRMAMFYGRGEADPSFTHESFELGKRRFLDDGFRLSAVELKHVGHDPRPFLDAADRLYQTLKETSGEQPRKWSASRAGQGRAKFLVKLAPIQSVRGRSPQTDGGMSSAACAAVLPGFDDRGWQGVRVPEDWDRYSGDWKLWDGEAVFRKSFVLPPALAGHELVLRLGYVDDTDKTFFNGEEIGFTDETTPYWEYSPRIYRIPKRLVRSGINVVSVRVFDRWLGGGIVGVLPEGVSVSEE